MLTSIIITLMIAGQPVNVDITDFPYVNPQFVAVLVDQESSNGLDKRHENYNQGKYGYLVGFTKRTYQDIERMAKTSLRYRNLLAKMNFDTPEGAIRSGTAYANHLMRDFGTTGNLKDGSTPKNIGMVELYKRYNGGGSAYGVSLFRQKYEKVEDDDIIEYITEKNGVLYFPDGNPVRNYEQLYIYQTAK